MKPRSDDPFSLRDLPHAFLEIDADGTCLEFHQLPGFTGCDLGKKLVGHKLAKALRKPATDQLMEAINNVVETGGFTSLERSVRICGRNRRYEMTLIPTADGNIRVLLRETRGGRGAVRRPRTARFASSKILENRPTQALLFVDLVDSTKLADQLGNGRWPYMLSGFRAVVERRIARFHGRVVDQAGDGYFCAFDSCLNAVLCSHEIRRDVGRLGMAIHAGLHAGECEHRKGELIGYHVHLASRIQQEAKRGEILASLTVRDLMKGNAFVHFIPRGLRRMKNISEPVRIFAVEAYSTM